MRLAYFVLLAAACNEAPIDAPDTGEDAGTEDSGRPDPASPNAPNEPIATDPPWPEAGYRNDCPFDQAHFVGTADCARVGTECPADGWPRDLPTDRPIVWVDDQASGGDGTSPASPLRSVRLAAGLAPAGGVVAIATGRYDEDFTVRSAVTLWGACVDGTRLTTTSFNDGQSHIYLGGDGAVLKNLSIDAPERIGILFDHDATLEDVVISNARIEAVAGNNGGHLDARRLVIRGTRPLASGAYGYGIQVTSGSSIVLEDAVVEHVSGLALSAAGGSSLEADRVAIHDVVTSGDDYGYAVWIGESSTATVANLAAARCTSVTLLATDGSRVVARDIATEQSVGIQAQSGSHLLLERAAMKDMHGIGFLVRDPGTIGEASDLIIRDVSDADDDRGQGLGVQADMEGRATIERILIERSQTVGVHVGLGAHLEARDVVVRDVKSALTSQLGEGIGLSGGGSAVIERALLERNREVGLIVSDEGSSLDATDLHVVDTIPREDGAGGPGLWAQISTTVKLTRARIERSTFVGLSAFQSEVTGTDVVIAGVVRAPCAETTCVDTAGGFGAAAHFGGKLSLERFAIEDAAVCGAVVGAPSARGTASGIDLAHGSIARAPIGACVQDDAFDSERLRNDVDYREVGVPLESTSYALPDTSPFE